MAHFKGRDDNRKVLGSMLEMLLAELLETMVSDDDNGNEEETER